MPAVHARPSIVFIALSAIVGLVVGASQPTAADDPPQRDSFTLPPGYSNAQTATDPTKPQAATEPGELRSYTTLHSVGIEWELAGDTNHNATCRVAYRRDDESGWHDALPLFRVDYNGWYNGRPADRAYNMLAGSVMFLRPGTAYRIKLTLDDPDGGSVGKELQLHSRPIPDAGTPLRTLHVVPRGANDNLPPGDGSAEKPLRGIDEANQIAKAGDLFLLHAGNYGDVLFRRSGAAPEQPGEQARYIVWKGAGDGPAEIVRAGVMADYLWFEGLSFKRGEQHEQGLRAAGPTVGSVVRGNSFWNYHYAVVLDRQSSGWYIADNDIVGDTVDGISGEGVELSHSSNHTVCYNRISRSADGISYALRNCDLFGNDIYDLSDDAIEPDYGYANLRIWGNRLAGPVCVSFQPMYCGPWYIVRNQMHGSTTLFKLRVQDRYLVANNTMVVYKPAGGAALVHAHGLLTATTRNNLWIHAGGGRFLWTVNVQREEKQRNYVRKHVLYDILKADWRTDVDYDGFDWSAADKLRSSDPAPRPIMWNGAYFGTLSELAGALGIERHGKMVDKTEIFEAYQPPSDPELNTAQPFLTLRRSGAAVDAGIAMPNVAEEFNGQGPDLGAYEANAPVPHIGPRSGDWRAVHDAWVLKHQRK